MYRRLACLLHNLCKWCTDWVYPVVRNCSNYWSCILDAFTGCGLLQCKDMRRNRFKSFWAKVGCDNVSCNDLRTSGLRHRLYGRPQNSTARDHLTSAWYKSSIILVDFRTRTVCLGLYCQFLRNFTFSSATRFRIKQIQQHFEFYFYDVLCCDYNFDLSVRSITGSKLKAKSI